MLKNNILIFQVI